MQDYPHYVLETTISDTDLNWMRRVSVAKICDILQRGATASAAELGVGMTDLLKDGHAWMMSALSVAFERMPRAGEKVRLVTWPSGVKGKLLCYRDYEISGEDGSVIVRGVADWIHVNIVSRKISWLTPRMMTMAPEGVPRTALAPKEPKPATEGDAFTADILVRHADVDVNRHVNNVHYIEWLFEPLPDELSDRDCARLDIAYRAEARFGDAVESVAWAADGGAKTVHELRRKADGQVLVSAVCTWAK